ncbi:carbon-nitrogen family hydrolase [Halococcus saccharolyticus]|uniref:Nitrilase n=1 Tax=Halococcus saccharolyticus DSM 5350 TaxID=1227455 RepID=M0MK14_9EURY|nr:carbon-nitrogen family hydrolase [Halococcus saccharolyticus]EMA45064.1 nitrilase [Halococcus saccharolyticus DSM 5350]
MELALAQLRIEAGDVTGNTERALAAIEDAAAAGADLVCLPEIFTIGYFAFDEYEQCAESLAGPTLTTIANAASEHDVAVLAGSIVEDLAESSDDGITTPAESGLANASVLVDRSGERQAIYRKHHLFGYESAEADLLVPGESLGVAEIGGFTVGMTTCYDLRFPELYRDLAGAGATLVLIPSAWPYPRVEHWQLLPRARAIENQIFVGTCNGSGVFGDTALCGRSSVYDPWGDVLAETDDAPAIVTADIDSDRVETVREEFPAWRDRRR